MNRRGFLASIAAAPAALARGRAAEPADQLEALRGEVREATRPRAPLTTLVVELDGRRLAEAVLPHLPAAIAARRLR